MAFLRSSVDSDTRPVLRADGLILRFPATSDYASWADLRGRSREHLVPWEPQWADDELSRVSYKMRLRHYERELREQTGYAFFVFRAVDEQTYRWVDADQRAARGYAVVRDRLLDRRVVYGTRLYDQRRQGRAELRIRRAEAASR